MPEENNKEKQMLDHFDKEFYQVFREHRVPIGKREPVMGDLLEIVKNYFNKEK